MKTRIPLVLGAFTTASIVLFTLLAAFSGVKSAGVPPLSAADLNINEDPGLVITGYVRLYASDGIGLDGVPIYRSYAAYPGAQIALTNLQGYYDSGYYYIPGDEMVTVWGSKKGYNIDPQQYFWRHYYSHENRELDFVAAPLVTNCSTPPAPNRILVDRGSWHTNELYYQLYVSTFEVAEAITITSEAGTTVKTEDLLPSTLITVPLLSNTTHHAKVDVRFGKVGCFYVTSTAYSSNGSPLTIYQGLYQKFYLPLTIK